MMITQETVQRLDILRLKVLAKQERLNQILAAPRREMSGRQLYEKAKLEGEINRHKREIVAVVLEETTA